MADEGPETKDTPEETTPEVEEPVVPDDTTDTPPSSEEAAPIKEDPKPTKKKISKKTKVFRWILGILFVLTVLAALTYFFKWHTPILNRVNAASVTFKVREDDTFALQGATITYREATYETDASGQVTIPETTKGDWWVIVTKEGYTPFAGPISLQKGDNGTISLSLEREPEKLFAFKGLVSDFVTEAGVSGAQISLSGQTATSDAAGGFTIDKLAAGDYKLTISKKGFTTLEQPVSVTLETATEAESFALVPEGKVLFVSNRDGGKRALYLASYDGQNQVQLVSPVAGTEDFGPVTSPDGKYIVFSTTRDKIPDSYNTGYVPRLYMVDSDGKNIKKISDDVSPAIVQWSASSKYLYFEAYQDSKLTTYTRRFYDLTKGSTFDLGESAAKVSMSTSGVHALYASSRTAADGTTIIHDIKTLDLVSSARRTIVEGVSDFMTSEAMTFSSDDKNITYQTQGSAGRKRYQVAFLGGTPTEIALPTEAARTYFTSPTGSLKAFLDTRDGKTDVFVVDSAGANEVRLTTLGLVSDSAPVVWDATGSYLTFALVKEGESAMYIVGSGGGEVQKIVDFTQDSQPVPYY